MTVYRKNQSGNDFIYNNYFSLLFWKENWKRFFLFNKNLNYFLQFLIISKKNNLRLF